MCISKLIYDSCFYQSVHRSCMFKAILQYKCDKSSTLIWYLVIPLTSFHGRHFVCFADNLSPTLLFPLLSSKSWCHWWDSDDVLCFDYSPHLIGEKCPLSSFFLTLFLSRPRNSSTSAWFLWWFCFEADICIKFSIAYKECKFKQIYILV